VFSEIGSFPGKKSLPSTLGTVSVLNQGRLSLFVFRFQIDNGVPFDFSFYLEGLPDCSPQSKKRPDCLYFLRFFSSSVNGFPAESFSESLKFY